MGQFHQEIKSIVHTCGERMEGEWETGSSVNEWGYQSTNSVTQKFRTLSVSQHSTTCETVANFTGFPVHQQISQPP